MATIIKIPISTREKNPKLRLILLYNRYNEITAEHCIGLIKYLYSGVKDDWINPLTNRPIKKTSDRFISFLSKCYYEWGDNMLEIDTPGLKVNLTYKEHITKFIPVEYLFDIPLFKKHPNISPLGRSSTPTTPRIVKSSSSSSLSGKRHSPPPVMRRRPGSNSPKKIKSPSPKRKSDPRPPGAAAQSPNPLKLEFPVNIKNSSKIIVEKKFITGDELTKERCNNFLTDIEDKLRGKTKNELSNIKFKDPINEKEEIDIGTHKLLIYLSKCYHSFDKPIKDRIRKIVNNVDDLIVLTDDKEKIKQAIPIIEDKLKKLMDNFNKFCDNLIKNWKDGNLPSHKYIADIVNAILVIIYTKYLHLYDNISADTYYNPLQIYMYDDTDDTFEYGNLKEYYDGKKIIYQKDDLMKSLNETMIDLKPKTIERYQENTLFNRQYVFELSKKEKIMTIKYNMINSSEQDINGLELDATLEDAYNLLFNKTPFNYNITNSILPKIIKIECLTPSVLRHFYEILATINTTLETLPVINDVRSTSDQRYNSVIANMEVCEFGDNDTIRKNILYSLNAQVPSYIKLYIELYSKTTLGLKDFYKDKIYYNYGYTGTFPLFTWIPISSSEPDGTIYNFPSSSKWQPYGDKTETFEKVDKAYKNYYTQPFSKSLNETIYKVISGESTDVDTIMTKRINETIGIYKDMNRAETYKNEKIYLYHGTNKKLHNMDGKKEDIKLLGFLSTTLNIYTASFYSEVGLKGNGFIYIIEVDDKQTYINLNDNLYQFILLPHSIIRIVHEFDYIGITIILCRLIETPTKEQSNELYNKLLVAAELTAAKVAVFYYIKQNNNAVPICAGFRSGDNFKYAQKLTWSTREDSDYCYTKIKSEYMDIFQIPREWLASATLPLKKDNKYELYFYFSLLQENELHIKKGEKTKGVYGGFDDIKYSIHQHFIKDCYKYLKIPCIDYVFLHGDENTNNKIATGILLYNYKNNRKPEYKYDINNLLIDCIFNFDSIDNNNKKLDLPGVDNSSKVSKNIYADKIEGFRNAGLYINGITNPLFRFDSNEQLDYILEYVKKYRNFLSKYSEASEENLKKHFECCNKKFEKLLGIIDDLKEQYLKFINDILQANSVSNSSMVELAELNSMLNNLADTLRLRALFQKDLTRTEKVDVFIKSILKALEVNTTSDAFANDIPLPENAKFADLIILGEEDKKTTGGFRKTKAVVGDYLKQIIPTYKKEKVKEQGMRKSSGTKREEANNKINASISGYKSMYKFEDLPKDFQKYYGKQNKGKEVDISNSCHIRLVPRKN